MKKKRYFRLLAAVSVLAAFIIAVPKGNIYAEESEYIRELEQLDRGAVAIKTTQGVFLSWRYLGTDTKDTSFVIYRNGEKITDTPLIDVTNYQDPEGTTDSVYQIETLLNNSVTEKTESITVLENQYFDIKMQAPQDGITPTGQSYSYMANDASCGDLDGDGEYEIVLKWMPTNSGDNMADGYRGNVYYDAYKLDGTRLWRIDMGVNIRAGAHYTPFMVYDFDGDGYAEMVVKTADGTIDGLGNVIGEADKDWRNASGTILDGPEYLTLFDGFTGEALDTVEYDPLRGTDGVVDADYWGDGFGNRSERYLAAAAYLDGVHASVVMCRGYYYNFGITAYDIKDKKLVKRWKFDTAEAGNETAIGQGNHNLAVADADGDGYDEIVYGACTIDHDGTLLYSSGTTDENGRFTGYGHGDALHVGDFDPDREGLEIWSVFEHCGGGALRDAKTGETIFRVGEGPYDTGRGIADNFVKDHKGSEYAYIGSGLLDAEGNPVKNADGNEIGWPFKWGMNSAIYWDGDLERQNLDRNIIECAQHGREYTAPGAYYINGTKANACLTADLFGDWREEMIFPVEGGLRVYTTIIPTSYRIPTLMHDSQYRCQVASQNVGYNQPPHLSYFLGTGYEIKEQPKIQTIAAPSVKTRIAAWDFEEESTENTIRDITDHRYILSMSDQAEIIDEADQNSRVLKMNEGASADLEEDILKNLTTLTLEMEFYHTESRDKQVLFEAETANGNLKIYVDDLQVTLEYLCNGEVQTLTGSLGTSAKWHTIAVSVDQNICLYIDGEKKEEICLAENEQICFLGKASIGVSEDDGKQSFCGLIDHIEIYNYARTENAISQRTLIPAVYEAKLGGTLKGNTQQNILKTMNAGVVEAVADAGYRFVCWSDGNTNAIRQDQNVTEKIYVTAVFVKEQKQTEHGLIMSCDFETLYDTVAEDNSGNGNVLILNNGQVNEDEITKSHVLKLPGKEGSYAEFFHGMFDGMDEFTIMMDVQTNMSNGNFFTFTVGKDDSQYLFYKFAAEEIRGAIKKSGSREEGTGQKTDSVKGGWATITLVVEKNAMRIYKDHTLLAENTQITTQLSDLGEGLCAWLGKSFFSADAWFAGAFDNIFVYNYAMNEGEVLQNVRYDTVELSFEPENPAMGVVEGDTKQAVRLGGCSTEVEAVAKDGYRFVCWNDGNTSAKRRIDIAMENTALVAIFARTQEVEEGLLAAYDFEKSYDGIVPDTSGMGADLNLFGNAEVIRDEQIHSNVLSLDGGKTSYAAVKDPVLDGIDSWTLKMKVKPEKTSGNFFTFAIGTGNTDYLYLRPTEKSWKAAMTTGGFAKEQCAEGGSRIEQDTWMEVILTVSPEEICIYQDGKLIAAKEMEECKTSDLGTTLSILFGKSFYDADAGYQGAIDEIAIYSYAFSREQAGQKTKKARIASFSFDNETDGMKGSGAVAVPVGKVQYADDKQRGKVLSFDEADQSWLKVMAEDKTSLLTDLAECSISYFVKITDGGWVFYAAPDEQIQSYQKEKYIGIRDGKGTFLTERYCNGRTSSASIALSADGTEQTEWKHVAVIFAASSIKIYINGELEQQCDSTAGLSQILGGQSIIQIGKANWENGEYFSGLLDDFEIYNYALNSEEVQKLSRGESCIDTDEKENDGPDFDADHKGNEEEPPKVDEKEDADKEMASDTDDMSGSDGQAGQQKDQMSEESDLITVSDLTKQIVKTDTDKKNLKNSSYLPLSLKGIAAKRKIRLSWKKVKHASGYIVYGAVCGKNMKKICELSGAKKTNVSIKGNSRYSKYIVAAYKKVLREKRIVSISATIHVTNESGKYKNPTGIRAVKTSIRMKKGKRKTLKPVLLTKGKVKLHTKKFRYESANPDIATVSASGKVRALKKGKCKIAAYSQNGLVQIFDVTVR